MTTTTPPCPVPWCSNDEGPHEWSSGGSRALEDVIRIHVRSTLDLPGANDRPATVVAAECREYLGGEQTMSVELYGTDTLYSWEQVDKVITAIRDAATLAFGEHPS